jgi:hypothetical protein
MSHALEIRTEETPASAAAIALGASSLWMLPILLLQVILQLFGQHLSKLRQMRRSKPMPKHWQDFYPDLRDAEWPVHVLLSEGARQILSGERLDLHIITFDPEPPDSFQPSMPRSAIAMHQRMEDLARFNADPERYVRRHAERIRDRDRDRARDRNPDSDIPAAVPVAAAVAVPVAIAIRGPP